MDTKKNEKKSLSLLIVGALGIGLVFGATQWIVKSPKPLKGTASIQNSNKEFRDLKTFNDTFQNKMLKECSFTERANLYVEDLDYEKSYQEKLFNDFGYYRVDSASTLFAICKNSKKVNADTIKDIFLESLKTISPEVKEKDLHSSPKAGTYGDLLSYSYKNKYYVLDYDEGAFDLNVSTDNTDNLYDGPYTKVDKIPSSFSAR